MEIRKQLLPQGQLKAKPADETALGFGKIMTDHMMVMDYEDGKGWFDPRIVPYGPFSMDPASLVFHYAQEIFEGLKAYRGADGGVYMFRPMENVRRMNRSCERMCIPELPEDVVMEAMYELVRTEQDWIPRAEGTSLYVRPTIIATEACLGVKVSSKYLFYIIVGPVGAYYPEGFNPIRIWVEENYVRAAEGGTGAVKAGCNYAASLKAAQEAHAMGFTQVLWLNARDRRSIEEVGTMNMFFKIDGEVITSPLDGSILPGVTRDSVLQICRDWGLKVSERQLKIDEVIQAAEAGKLEEAFGTGTAAVISPVGSIHYKGKDHVVADGNTGELSLKLYDEITGVQLGHKEDKFNWVVRV